MRCGCYNLTYRHRGNVEDYLGLYENMSAKDAGYSPRMMINILFPKIEEFISKFISIHRDYPSRPARYIGLLIPKTIDRTNGLSVYMIVLRYLQMLQGYYYPFSNLYTKLRYYPEQSDQTHFGKSYS